MRAQISNPEQRNRAYGWGGAENFPRLGINKFTINTGGFRRESIPFGNNGD
jgi:hypothetical protein